MNDLRLKKHHLFCLNFKEHVRTFIKEYDLIHPNKKIILSVSGGVDSLAMADIFGSFGEYFEILHFNHGTRPKENLEEEKLVMDLGEKLGVKVNVFRFEFSLNQKNFEKTARFKRNQIYSQFINDNAWVYTAHHIDDSFEWTMMQSFKQSSLRPTLGIPVFNNGLVRPFMCVTKKQIRRYAHARKLDWMEDSSNQNDRFERNYLRMHVTKDILKRYPKMLRHYVSRQNQLAQMQYLHRTKRVSDLTIIKEESGSVILISDHLENHKTEIKNIIHQKSESSRGEIDVELEKLLSAHKIIMSDQKSFPFKGPMNFSGGVQAYLIKNTLLLTNNQDLSFYKTLDHRLQKFLAISPQIPSGCFSLPFPQIVISGTIKLKKASKYIHPLLPATCSFLKNNGISYVFAPLISIKDRQMLVHDAVILDSSVLGL
ncbi:MAG: tRNA lysidine(34) synthetase TilS [Bacteriovorax sp.]|nr:tRNA lysidine(34) synthetase TilS [Bacteriovorax sp.]